MDYLVSDTDLTSVADAIRTKGGTSAQLEFPNGFNTAIANLPSGGGGGLSGYMNEVEITFTNSLGALMFGSWYISAYIDGFKQFPEINELLAIVDVLNVDDHIRIYVPVEYWGIQIFPLGGSPDGVDYTTSNITLTGNLTLNQLWDGFVIQVTGNGTVAINGVDFDP